MVIRFLFKLACVSGIWGHAQVPTNGSRDHVACCDLLEAEVGYRVASGIGKDNMAGLTLHPVARCCRQVVHGGGTL